MGTRGKGIASAWDSVHDAIPCLPSGEFHQSTWPLTMTTLSSEQSPSLQAIGVWT